MVKRFKLAGLLSALALAVGLGLNGAAGVAQADAPTPVPGVYYEVFAPYNAQSSYQECAEVPSASMTPDSRLQIYHCHSGVGQLWQFFKMPGTDGWDGSSGGLYWLVNKNSGMCMGLSNSEFYVKQELCNPGDDSQLWGITPSSIDFNNDGLFQLFNGDFPANCLETANVLGGNSTPVEISDRCDVSSTPDRINESQTWKLG
ncbi:MAG TPA: RICIN domain-containing protein [Streptosporangiaceae bacterium]|nr:RICIN domain-containing protein [Streptosporangiaceae bacterium]